MTDIKLWYVGSPVTTYSTKRYDTLKKAIQNDFPAIHPGSTFLFARGLYGSSQEWKRKWPSTLHTIGGMLFFTDTDNCIGRGVWIELRDVFNRGLPVYFVTNQGTFIRAPKKDSVTWTMDTDNWKQYARLEVIAGAYSRVSQEKSPSC
jgi:hypothetical protein